ncbi:PTS sugar transporter subunit IIB [Vagococcus luciliae]|uniref:PTS system galactitol-specific EIIB component n=1 Tax=Vagococcus luciliae TaxID=2920380 RepID=A0ABY5NY52_9ENTE|nr:PTS sugar transporter subunit IIB [Vagococcus luciliae]UUV98584.1 PTS system galactitol-specific EIIB component [Vagococcus luciliae]
MKKRVLVACGAGIATSTIVMDRIERLLKREGIEADLMQIKIVEAKKLQSEADILISTTILPTTYDIPAIVATSYITGIGIEDIDNQIIDILK